MGRWAWFVAAFLAFAACRERADTQPIEEPPTVEPEKDDEGGLVTDRDPPDAGTVTVDPEPRPDGGSADAGIPESCPPNCPPDAGHSYPREDATNPIPAENEHAGAPDWRRGRSSHNAEVELYTGTDSLFAGEPLAVKVSTSIDTTVTAEVYRMGDYGGAGARLMWRSDAPINTSKQANCVRTWDTARVECAWTDSFQIPTGEAWVSGLYVVKVIRADGYRRFAPFVIRDHRRSEILFGVGFNTSQAYNFWGGESLYSTSASPYGRSFEVSYDRPYREIDGNGKVFYLELPLIQFLERHGYDVTYVTNLDFVRFEGLLEGISAFVHGGQDEYWNEEQRTQVDAALATGQTSLVYFGGNGAYWRTRTLSSNAGVPNRILVCYKGAPQDPLPASTRRYRDEPDPLPENALLGVMYDGWQLMGFPLVVKDASHWIFDGTGLANGDLLPPILGFEYDKVFDNGFSPDGLQVALDSPVVSAEGLPSRSHAVSRTLPSGTLVFSAGTIWWPQGLSKDEELADGRIDRITLNVLERALQHRRARRTLSAPPAHRPPSPQLEARWAQSVEPFAGVAGTSGFRDGPAATARFNGPTGIAVDSTGRVAIADTGNNAVRLISADAERTVSTLAGDGRYGHVNGPGRQAMFRAPTAVAFAPDGAIYVADSDNHVIRRIANDAPTYTVSTYAGVMRSQGYADGPADTAKFRRPTAMAIDAAGNLFVADQAGNRIRRIDALTRQVTTIAGGALGFRDAALGADAQFNNPSAIALGPSGELYVVDAGNGSRIRRISATPEHSVQSLAGRSTEPYYGYADGPGDQARFRAQMGMVVTADGEVLIADTGNFRIRKLVPGADAASTQVYTFAGDGRVGSTLGPAQSANLTAPAGLATLSEGHFLVTDSYFHAVRLIVR